MAYKSSVLDIEKNLSVGTHDNENKESTTLIWFDPNIKSHEDIEKTKEQLRLINDYVIFFTDLEQCIRYIESIDKEKILLIISGSKASEILPRICSYHQIDSIFIFSIEKDQYEYLLNEYSKIIGIYINFDDLYKSIKEQIDLVNKQIETLCYFDQHQILTKDLSKESAKFLLFQLFNYVISHFSRNEQAKQQMIEISLKTEDIDLLYQFRFFISDLSENLQRQHEKILLSQEKILNVYRGIKLDKEEFNKLKQNQEKLISINGYLLTS
ncbi:unnamed protein product [Rotaria sordida]|uniref:Uncharacterized protein n=1 Tax=Rotaria sordida TaxID=392033 RepID=A0A815F5K3_9BILA|nr:unnamed protein product [Rotaria sordida]CAF3849842.1 unnamed protein product [Rotaria sordida]